jgi:hypothetical protein
MNQQLLAFGNSPYASPYYSIGIEECINLYMEKAISLTSKVPQYFVSIPGLKLFSKKQSDKVCRGLYKTSDSRLFGVFGNQIQEILQNGSRRILGTLTTYSGTVSISDNTHQVLFVDGQFGYILSMDTNIFQQIDQNIFPNGATHCTCIDTYFLVNQPNSINYNWSSQNDGLNWDPLDFATKEGMPDNIVAIKELNNQLWVFGSYSTEVHWDTADTTTQVWQRYEGAIIDVGCTAKYSVQRIENNIFWIGTDKTGNVAVWSNNGLVPIKVSTRGIEQLILAKNGQDTSKAVGYVYAQAGHVFYIINFMSSDLTLVYDVTTQTWHTRTYLDPQGVDSKWRGFYSAFNWGKNLFGDYLTDCVYEASLEYYLNDEPDGVGFNQIKRVRSTPIIQSNQKRIRHNSLQILFEQGVGLNDNNQLGYGISPKCMLYCSDDSGHSWSNVRISDIGAIGNYDFRTRFLQLGHSRNRIYKIIVTDPVKILLVGLVLDYQELSF